MEVIGESSDLSAAAQLHRWAASYSGRDVVQGYLFTATVSLTRIILFVLETLDELNPKYRLV
jgi:hypothetical protein